MRRLIPICALFLVSADPPSLAGDLPIVEAVEAQPLAAQVRRLLEALELLGQPLPDRSRARLKEALADDIPAERVRSIQEVLDPLCLVGVTINPEGRVRADRGPAPASLVQHQWPLCLIKVRNQAR